MTLLKTVNKILAIWTSREEASNASKVIIGKVVISIVVVSYKKIDFMNDTSRGVIEWC